MSRVTCTVFLKAASRSKGTRVAFLLSTPITPWSDLLLPPPLRQITPIILISAHLKIALIDALSQNGRNRKGLRCKSWVHICGRFDPTFIYSTVLDPHLRASHLFPRGVHPFMWTSHQCFFSFGAKTTTMKMLTKSRRTRRANSDGSSKRALRAALMVQGVGSRRSPILWHGLMHVN
jgi:hypothetical protein